MLALGTVVLEIGLTDTLFVLSGPHQIDDTLRCPEYDIVFLLVKLHHAYDNSVEFHESR